MTDTYTTLPINQTSSQCTFTFLLPEPNSIPTSCTLPTHATLRLEKPPNLSTIPQWKDNTVSTNDLNAINYNSGGIPYWTPMRNSCAVYHLHSPTRSIRIKQYLFLDYGPHPTHHSMIPPIGSYKAKTETTPSPRLEFEIGQRACGWIGIDYAGKHVAQLMLHGTCIEVRITTGTFTDTELIKLCNGFVAIEEENPEESTYHMNSSYYKRYPKTHHGFLVPSSLFARDVSNFGLPHCAYPEWMNGTKAPTNIPRRFGMLSLNSFGILDGNGELHVTKKETPMETFALYTDENRDSMAWVRTIRSVGPKEEEPLWPPQPGAYPCETPMQEWIIEEVVEHYQVFTANVTRENGPHCAAIKNKSNGMYRYVHATPRPGFNANDFFRLIRELLVLQSKI